MNQQTSNCDVPELLQTLEEMIRYLIASIEEAGNDISTIIQAKDDVRNALEAYYSRLRDGAAEDEAIILTRRESLSTARTD